MIHQTLWEHLFAHLSIIIVLIALYVLKLECFEERSGNWYLNAFYVSSLLYSNKDLIDLHYMHRNFL